MDKAWTGAHVVAAHGLYAHLASPCQGEGRGFESRLPLRENPLLSRGFLLSGAERGFRFAHHCSRLAHHGAVKRAGWLVDVGAMTGSVRARGVNSWELRVYAGTDPLTGKRRWVTRTVRGSRTEAQRELAGLAAVANVGPVVGAITTVGELLERWFSVGPARWATTTARNVCSINDRQLVPGLGSLLVREVTTAQIDEFYADLRRSPQRNGAGLSGGTVRRVHAVLHSALAQAMRWEWIWINPAANATPPRGEPVDIRPPSPEELNRLFEHVAVRDPRLHLLFVLAATTGARRGQLLGLRWGDVDLERGALLFQRALVDGLGGPEIGLGRRARKADRTHRYIVMRAYCRRF